MIKTLVIFISGIVFATVVLIGVGRYSVSQDQVLGTSTINVSDIESQVKTKVQQGEKEGLTLVKEGLLPKIISLIVENPLLAPFIKTQKEVGEAVSTVKDLPGDQQKAICDQICP